MSAQLSRTHPRGSDERRRADPSESGAMPMQALRGVGSLRAGSSVNEGCAAISHWRRRSEDPWKEPEQVHRISGSPQAALGMPGYPYREAKFRDPFLLECRSSARSVPIAFQGLSEPPNGVVLKRTGSLKGGTIWPHFTSMDTSLKLC